MLHTGHGEDQESVAERIFQVALAHPEDERDSYIQHATRGDAELMEDVFMLLEGYREEGGDEATATLGAATSSRMDLAIIPGEEPGTVIDHFRLIRLVGEGGMGSVWEAQQTGTVKRTVALKVLKLGMDTREVVARFERERQTLALMRHPNIAQVFEAGATQTGRPYFAMEFVDGEPITDYCDRNRLNIQERLHLFMRVCGAVQHAHQKGVIHRDIKPSNILVMNGLPKVIDFGVAKATRSGPLPGTTLHTRQSQILGTPAYMSPEQAGGNNEDIDTRTDIYALGALLYELLTGTTPVDAKKISRASPAELERILKDEIPTRPSNRLATTGGTTRIPAHLVRGDLDWITMRCLAKDRTERYITANALVSDIGRHLRNEPVSAAAPTPWYYLVKWAARNRVAFLAGSAVLLSMIVGTVVSIWQARIAGEEATNARLARNRTQALLESSRHEAGKALLTRALALANEKKHFRAKLTAGQAIGFDGFGRDEAEPGFRERMPRLLNAGSAEEEAARSLLHRHSNYALLWQSPYTAHHDGRATSVSWNNDGTLLATCSPNDNTIHIWNTTTGARVHQIKTSYAPWTVCFSPDGSTLAVGGESAELHLFQPFNGAVIRSFDGGSGAVLRLQFSTDGNELAAIDGSGFVRFWNSSTGELLTSIGEAGNTLFDFTISQDGSTLATAGIDEFVRVWNRKTGEVKWSFSESGNDPFAVALDHRGTTLFGGLGSGQIDSWDLTSGQIKPRVFQDHIQAIYRVKISPNGTMLASASWDSETRISHISDGSEVGLLKGHSTRLVDAEFSPDNQKVATVSNDNTVRIWNLTTGQEIFPVIGHSKKVNCVKFSKDGRYLASAGDDRGIRIWNLQNGASRQIVSGHVRDIVGLDFNPSGTVLASVSQYGIVRFWDPASGDRLREASIRHPECTGLRFLSESRIATAGEDGSVRVWSLDNGEALHEFTGHEGVVSTIDVSSGLKNLASGSGDRTVVLWDLESGRQAAPFIGHTNAVSAVRFHPRGTMLASADESGIIRFWDLKTGLLTNSMNACPGKITAIDFSPDGTKLAAAESDGSIYLFRMGTGKLEAVLDGHRGKVNDVAFSQDGTLLATAGSDRTVALWEAQGSDRATVRAHDTTILAMEWTSRGIVTSDRVEIRRWDSQHLQEMDAWEIGEVGATSIDELVDKGIVAVGTAGGDVHILKSGDTGAVNTLHAHNDRVDAVRFTPDGRHFATAGKDGWVRVWERDSLRLAYEIDISEASVNQQVPLSLCFSHDGSRLFCAGMPDGSIQTWLTADYSKSSTLEGHSLSTRALSAHPTQPILASASADETIRLWSTENLRTVAVLTEHAGEVYDVSFDPAGAKLASASEDQTIIVWNVNTRQKLETLEGHIGVVQSVRFDTGGNHLVSAGEDGDLRLWDLEQADSNRYAMDFEKFRSDGLHFTVDQPVIASALGIPVRPPAMPIPSSTQLAALRTPGTDIARFLFWRNLQAGNYAAACSQWNSLPEDDRATERLALCRAIAREVQSARGAGQEEFHETLLRLAEGTGEPLPDTETARTILTLRSSTYEQGLSAARQTLAQLPPTALRQRKQLLEECLNYHLQHDDFLSARDALQTLSVLAGETRTSDRHYEAYAAKSLTALTASLSTESPNATTGLRGLALLEYFRQAIALSPFDGTRLKKLLTTLTAWEEKLHPEHPLVDNTAVWRYLDRGTDPGLSWNHYHFDDQSWGTGQAPLGFGSKANTTTTLHRNASSLRSDPSWITFHFRYSFPKPELGRRKHLVLRCDYDDGMIAYLNGHEVGRSNMPAGKAGIDTPASVYQSEPGRSTFQLKADQLEQDNIVAVEVHQREPSSSDIYFDLSLSGIVATPDTYLASIDNSELAESLDWLADFLPDALIDRWLPTVRFTLEDQAPPLPSHFDPALCWLARARIQGQRDRAESAKQALENAVRLAANSDSILHKGVLNSAREAQ
ncbi:MAG: protein kinase [Verrucomicrobiales bacterium]